MSVVVVDLWFYNAKNGKMGYACILVMASRLGELCWISVTNGIHVISPAIVIVTGSAFPVRFLDIFSAGRIASISINNQENSIARYRRIWQIDRPVAGGIKRYSLSLNVVHYRSSPSLSWYAWA